MVTAVFAEKYGSKTPSLIAVAKRKKVPHTKPLSLHKCMFLVKFGFKWDILNQLFNKVYFLKVKFKKLKEFYN